MLIITFHNDGSGTPKGVFGNYNVKVKVNDQIIYEGRIENHLLTSGWQGLVKYFAKKLPAREF